MWLGRSLVVPRTEPGWAACKARSPPLTPSTVSVAPAAIKCHLRILEPSAHTGSGFPWNSSWEHPTSTSTWCWPRCTGTGSRVLLWLEVPEICFSASTSQRASSMGLSLLKPLSKPAQSPPVSVGRVPRTAAQPTATSPNLSICSPRTRTGSSARPVPTALVTVQMKVVFTSLSTEWMISCEPRASAEAGKTPETLQGIGGSWEGRCQQSPKTGLPAETSGCQFSFLGASGMATLGTYLCSLL